jgi:hypothetical protein
MARISEFSSIRPLLDSVAENTKGCTSLEEASQKVIDLVYEEFKESIALARLFSTVPFGKLPASNRGFVSRLGEAQGISNLINEETLVLSLLGTRGIKPAWNDRIRSEGHVGIPLVSANFLDRIPMVSRLLTEVGLDLDWANQQEAVTIKTLARLLGVFHVMDAESAIDDQGRKIISAQDFVRDHNIKTVFGLAGGYAVGKTFLTLILFCRETVDRPKAEHFLPLLSCIKAGTTSLVSSGALFV